MIYVARHEQGDREALLGIYGPFVDVEGAMIFGQMMGGIAGPWFWERMVKPETALANRQLNGSH